MAKYLNPQGVMRIGRKVTGLRDHDPNEVVRPVYFNGMFHICPYDDIDAVEESYRRGILISRTYYAIPESEIEKLQQ